MFINSPLTPYLPAKFFSVGVGHPMCVQLVESADAGVYGFAIGATESRSIVSMVAH
jgi:hypothetical protein